MMALKQIVVEEEKQESMGGEFVKPPEIHEEVKKEEKQRLNISAKQVIRIAGNIMARIKCKTEEGRKNFIKEYVSLNETILGLLGFDEAIQEMPIPELSPTVIVGISGVVLVVTGLFFVNVDESEYLKQETKEETKEEQKTEPPKEPTPEELEEYLKYVEENQEGGENQ